jgi:hypothetical protein
MSDDEVKTFQGVVRTTPIPLHEEPLRATEVVQLVPTKPEAEIAAELKKRLEEAFKPIAALIDEAAKQGLQVQWDQFAPGPPWAPHHTLVGLRLVRHY